MEVFYALANILHGRQAISGCLGVCDEFGEPRIPYPANGPAADEASNAGGNRRCRYIVSCFCSNGSVFRQAGGTLNAFFPSLDAIVLVTDLITAVLLYAQFSISRSRSLLVLASGYFFTALIVIPHALTFSGAFSPTGLFGAGLQTGSWLFIFWHIGFAAALLGYAIRRT